MSSETATLEVRNRKRKIVLFVVGLFTGAGCGYGIVTLARALHINPKSLSWADLGAGWIGLTFIGVAGFVAFLATNPNQLARQLEGEDASLPATPEELRTTRFQALVLALAGILMLTPVLASGPLKSTPAAAPAVFAAIVVLFLWQSYLNLRLWRLGDEFARATLVNVSALTFAFGQGVFFLWAAAERLHLVQPVSSWALYAILMALYMLANWTITLRQYR